MNFLTVKEIAEKWNCSKRSVRNYCVQGRVIGAVLENGAWLIPVIATKPTRKPRSGKYINGLLERLKAEKQQSISGGIYHKLQIELTYNSNHMEGSRLTHDQTRFIFETNTIGIEKEPVNVDDIIETRNHFRCIDYVIDLAAYKLTESFIKQLHGMLKSGTKEERMEWFSIGDYKKLPNEVGGKDTIPPEQVTLEMKKLLFEYDALPKKNIEDIIAFHYHFESIHPFQDGNGRIGRLILLKECLKYNLVPFVIDEEMKMYYYRGLAEYPKEKGYLIDTCLAAQDKFKAWLDYFRILYE